MAPINDKDMEKVSGGEKMQRPFGVCKHFELKDGGMPFDGKLCLNCKHYSRQKPTESGACNLSE